MTLQLACLLVGVILPYVWAGASVPLRIRQLGSVDLVSPRLQAEQLKDAGAWVVGAQGNAWEALGVFSAANLAAFMAGVDPAGAWGSWCLVWVAARVVHGVGYLAGKPVVRVAGFVAGVAASMALFVLAFLA